MKQPKFEAYEDQGGEWRWRLVAKNGRIVADSGEGYTNKGACLRAIATTTRIVESIGHRAMIQRIKGNCRGVRGMQAAARTFGADDVHGQEAG